eukprot:TRINITY_DN960_c0_g1_i1.p1 TRINITY_DN960_c0_g1~~TRINITY_DN960_c0_g1_i1.p1  ORF type:complete len:586 (-),score=213.57 TRINITY_DN960_c0_g1_i1:33-1790(-)
MCIRDRYEDIYVTPFHDHVLVGTSGIRNHSKYLEYPIFRSAIFASLVSRINTNKCIGIIITASHNPKDDNGMKITDFEGTMLRSALEDQQNKFIVEKDIVKGYNDLIKNICQIAKIEKLDFTNPGHVLIAHDTRYSSEHLTGIAVDAITSCKCTPKNFGQQTTPQLHHFVFYLNSEKYNPNHKHFNFDTPQKIIADHYYDYYCDNFLSLIQKKEKSTVIIDCSNGVGGKRVDQLKDKLKDVMNLEFINKEDNDKLNVECGAEHVQKEKAFCTYGKEKLEEYHKKGIDAHIASFDGDADRIVFFFTEKDTPAKIHLNDGDKIDCLMAFFVQEQLNKISKLISQLTKENLLMVKEDFSKWVVGSALTGYTNGCGVKFLRDQGVDVKISPSGVKNLHHVSLDFDIGVYFEANGHGTLIVNNGKQEILEEFIETLKGIAKNIPAKNKETFDHLFKEATILAKFFKLSNQVVGDAISDFLMIEAILNLRNMTMKDWENIYIEYPNLTTKVVVKYRQKIKVNWDQTRITEPKELQDEFDKIVAKYKNARTFSRPSGTEDIVRVYIESEIYDDLQKILVEVKQSILSNKVIN